jgi:hypothetical protein
MRGMMFPNANIIFDVQTNDPAIVRKLSEAGGGALTMFANIYNGWDVVENAAIVLEEAPDLIMKPDARMGNRSPSSEQGLREAARIVLKASQEKNQAQVSDATNDLVEACLNCHTVYRNSPPGGPKRCVPK